MFSQVFAKRRFASIELFERAELGQKLNDLVLKAKISKFIITNFTGVFDVETNSQTL